MATTEQQEGAGTIAPPPVVARLMFPDDANIAGNVHGGTILQLMEQAGMIAATRFLNEKSSDDDDEQQQQRGDTNGGDTNKRLFFAALQRFETMSFHKPIYIGNVASVTARVVFTSERTVLLKVIVTAEDLAKGSTCTTNSGLLWYTCWTRKNKDDDSDDSQPGGGGGGYSLVPIPRQVVVPPEGGEGSRVGFDEYQKAKSMYEKRKKRSSTNLSTTNGDNTASEDTVDEDEYEAFVASNPATNAKTPSSSKQRLCQMVLPGDCGTDSKIALGGFVMKLMDNAAGCVAYRHCLRNVVTISINAMDFTSFVRLGHLVTIDAKIVYCSNKTMEIGVTASTESPDDINKDNNNDDDDDGGVDVVVVAKAMFTFVALDSQTRRPIGVPPLRLETGDELKQAFEAKQAYEQAKRERAK